MSSSPLARIQNLSVAEKEKLSAVLMRRLFFRAGLFLLVILTSVGIILFFNAYSTGYHAEDNLGVLNVVFVIISVLCARLVVAEFLSYRKEMSSPVKKVIHTKIAGRKDDKIILGNKSFGKEEIMLDSTDFDSLKGGDDVLLELSAKSNTIFSVKKNTK